MNTDKVAKEFLDENQSRNKSYSCVEQNIDRVAALGDNTNRSKPCSCSEIISSSTQSCKSSESTSNVDPANFVTCQIPNLPESSTEESSGEKLNLNLCKFGENSSSPCEMVQLDLTKELLQLENLTSSFVSFIFCRLVLITIY